VDTIFALASARGKAGVAVVRISGPAAHDAAAALCGRLPAPRRAGLRRLRWRGEVLDEGLVLVFPQGASFTGEAAAELHLHGSTAVIRAVLAALAAQPGLRPAEPGEFTRRAVEAGRLDLAQVEGLADLIDAETDVQRRQALTAFSGALARRVETWRGLILRATALVEATIDFADEDVPVDVAPEVESLLAALLAALGEALAGSAAAERVRDGFEVAIVGRPNVGKSTLLNALAGRDAALTSPLAGTTRDVLEVRMDIAGLPVTVLDTAGLRDSGDALEAMGVARARERAEAADLRVILVEGGEWPEGIVARDGDLVVAAKADLGGSDAAAAGAAVSGRTGAGVEALLGRIAAVLGERAAGAGLMIGARQRAAVRAAMGALESARDRLRDDGATEFVAEHLHQARRSLERLTGRVDVEEVLGEIFARFCIGK
jgi:tRNA modification GTPase